MIFETPQWSWRQAYAPVGYGFVHNEVIVFNGRKEWSAFVAIPIEFFQLLDTVFTDSEKAEAVREGIHFYLLKEGDRWVFGFETRGGECAYRDLWFYTPSTLPRWADVAVAKR